MSQHGRHTGGADEPRKRKLVSIETLLVLALVCVIAGASVIVNRIDPGRQRTQTITGQTTTKTQLLGQGGIQPGDIQPRTITPVHSAASDQLSGVTPAPTPKALKTGTGKATPAPTTSGSVGTATGTGTGTGSTGGTTTPGSPPKSGGNCGLSGLLGGCPKGTATGPESGSTSANPPVAQ